MKELRREAGGGLFGLRLSGFYFVSFLIVGCYMPYLPLWLDARGLSGLQISIIYAAPIFLRAGFTPLLTFLADRSGRPVRFLSLASWGALASVAILPLTNEFYSIFLVVLLFTLFWMSVIPLTDAVALAGVRTGRADYGRMRLWGSVSYIVMTLAGGAAIDQWGAQTVLWLLLVSAFGVALASHILPDDKHSRPKNLTTDNQSTRISVPLRFADVTTLIRHPDFWLFLAAAGAIQAAHALYYIFGTLHWTSAGISPLSIGGLWSIGVIAEILLFAYGKPVSRYFGPVQLIVLAGAVSVFRWTSTAFDPALPVLFLIQILHGITFGAAHLGAMQFMQRAVPASLAASAQGLYASLTAGVAMGFASLAAGPLYRAFDGQAYLAMAAISAGGLLAAWILRSRWNGGLIVGAGEARSER